MYNVTGIDVSEGKKKKKTVQAVQPSEILPPKGKARPRWERCLPPQLVISTLDDEGYPSSQSLNLKVGIETTDTREAISMTALVDSGATGCFIDRDYVKANQLTTRTLSVPIPVRNVDGTPNKAGAITEVVDLIQRYENHSERTLFAVTGLGNQDLILGHAWLKKHNPEINWVTGELKMSRCSAQCCSGCHWGSPGAETDKRWQRIV